MCHRPSSEVIQSLLATLRHIEENLAVDANVSVLLESKRIILLRIAELEATNGATKLNLPAESSLPRDSSIPGSLVLNASHRT
jgi:hypothetical protein